MVTKNDPTRLFGILVCRILYNDGIARVKYSSIPLALGPDPGVGGETPVVLSSPESRPCTADEGAQRPKLHAA